MSSGNSVLPVVSSESRRIAAERFDRANQVIATGNYDYGIQLLLTCCKLDPANFLFRQTLRRTQKAKFDNNLRGSRLAFLTTFRSRAKLKAAKTKRDYLRVLEYGEAILSKNPWDIGVQMDMAEAADHLGMLDIAVFILDQARQKSPKDAPLNRALARLFEKRGNFTHAITLWQLVKEAVPSDVEAAHKAKDLAASETIQRGGYTGSGSGTSPGSGGSSAGTAEMRSSDRTASVSGDSKPLPKLSAAAESSDRVSREAAPILARITSNPTDPNLYMQLANVYRRANQINRARAAIEQGLGPTGNHFQLTMELAEMDLETMRKNLAIVEKKLSEDDVDPDSTSSSDEHLRMRTKLVKEIAVRELELARHRAERFPNDATHRMELGIRLMQLEKLDEAIVELQNARKDAKQGWRAAMQLGVCFQRKNNWKLAQRNFEEALAGVPTSDFDGKKDILFHLADGHAKNGELAKAIDLGHDLANLDYGFKDIGKLIDEWQQRLQEA